MPTSRQPNTLIAIGLLSLVCGCGTDVQSLVDTSRKVDARAQKFHETFPGAKTGTSSWHGKHRLSAWTALAGGHVLYIQGEFPTRSERGEYQSTGFHLRTSDGDILELTEEEFDALLGAKGDAASLKEFGIDLAARPVDEAKVTASLCETDPQIGKLYEAFPEAGGRVPANRYRRTGTFSASAQLGEGYKLNLSCDLKLDASGTRAEAIWGERRLWLDRENLSGVREPDSVPFQRFLSDEEFDALVEAKEPALLAKKLLADDF